MNRLQISQALQNLLSSPLNKLKNGSSIYHKIQESDIHQNDESSITLWILSSLPYNPEQEADDEWCNKETIICDALLNLTTPIGFDKQELQTPNAPIIWVNGQGDSLIIKGTDNTIYITFIQSGQY